MKTNDDRNPQRIPEWVEREFADMPAPPEEFLARYDYLKDDFLAAIERVADPATRKAAAGAGKAAIEVVFSLAGELLDRAIDLIDRYVSPPDSFQVACVTARSPQVHGGKGFASERSQGPVGCVSKNVGTHSIEVATYRVRNRTELEVDVLQQADKTQVRPLDVEVLDADRHPLAPAVHVTPQDLAPRFPGPSAGVYVLKVRWSEGSGEIRVEFR